VLSGGNIDPALFAEIIMEQRRRMSDRAAQRERRPLRPACLCCSPPCS
jgi:hypothetical protein